MTSGWQCSRCGTRYGVFVGASPRVLGKRWRLGRCLARQCPTTFRALLWRIVCWRERRLLRSDDAMFGP